MIDQYPQIAKEQFHVFTDGADEYYDTEKEARKAAKGLKKDGSANIRIYHDTEWNAEDGIFEDGDCIYSYGAWPS